VSLNVAAVFTPLVLNEIHASTLPSFSAKPTNDVSPEAGLITANLTDELPQLMTKIMVGHLNKVGSKGERSFKKNERF
jgi:hypothetical protein